MIRLLKFLKPFAISIIAVFVLTFLQAISQLRLPQLMSSIVDVGIVKGDTPFILRTGLQMLLVATLGSLCTVGTSYFSSTTSAGFGRLLRSKVFSRVESFALNEFDRIGTSTLITRTTNDVTHVQQAGIMIMRMMMRAPMMLIGGLVMAVSTDAKLSRILVFSMPLLFLAVYGIARQGYPLFRVIQQKLDRVNRVLREGLTGIRVIRAFNRTDYETRRFNEANLDLTSTNVRVGRLMTLMDPAISLIFNFTTIAVVWLGSQRVDLGEVQIGALMAFVQYIGTILFALMQFSFLFMMLPRAAASAERINEILDTEPVINDPLVPTEPGNLRGHVEFRDVTFAYPGAETPAVQNISFESRPGELTAIIGGTGSGKSTLLNLITRFYDVDHGQVLVDGVDVREMNQQELRQKIGLVPQASVLFTGSVAENIRYGKEDATDEEVQHAAAVAQASEFISGMPGGFDAWITQGGTNLSGGQKQRMSIARALVRRPEIYLFDDSFSALDFKTDARLRAALRNEMGNSTVLIVAQRVSTVMDADQIIVLDEGKIAGIGTHRDLLKSCQVYREIVASQLSEEELA